ncbi:MAG TPA: Gfo/Idh/MocA family oxidoreductase [Blastocatellia bacterium]|nr:Gfo/Idh/MocA family oxidoreductase [Blastocatellia bacterium]
MIRAGVVGVGHFGREHARIYSSNDHAKLVAVCDLNESRGRGVAETYGAEFGTNYRDLMGRVDAVSVATSTVSHQAIACELLEAGIAVLVEKPIAASLAEAEEMISAARRGKAVLQVGHLERFNPAVTAASRIVTRPLFFEAHRLSPFTPRSLDIDVVMDLMVHDIDVVLSLARSEVREVRASGVPILSSKVDIANARIEFENGCVANLTASRVSAERVRKVRFFQPHEYVSIDYSAQESMAVSIKTQPSGRMDFDIRALPVERGEPLSLEIESFLRAVSGQKVEVSGEDGKRALQLALEINSNILAHAERAGVTF